MTSPRRVRVSIDAVPLQIQPNAEEVARFYPRRSGEAVMPLDASPRDRAEGVQRFEVIVDGWRFEAMAEPARRAQLRERVARQAAEHQSSARLTLRAQIPGRVVRLWVSVGDKVEPGQRLLAIEAMKMENEIRAPRAGVVDSIAVEVGQRLEREGELLTIG